MRLPFATTIALSFLLAVPVLRAQDEPKPKPEEPKPSRQEPAQPAEHNPAEHNKEMQEQNKPPKDEMKQEKQDKKEENDQKKEESKSPRQEGTAQDHGAQHARPAGKSAHIPDDQFRQRFGRQHTVVINRPVIVEGQPRFQYGGYWFVIYEPWPAEWAYTDECYIDYEDGDYYLFDLLHPGVRVALFVVM